MTCLFSFSVSKESNGISSSPSTATFSFSFESIAIFITPSLIFMPTVFFFHGHLTGYSLINK